MTLDEMKHKLMIWLNGLPYWCILLSNNDNGEWLRETHSKLGAHTGYTFTLLTKFQYKKKHLAYAVYIKLSDMPSMTELKLVEDMDRALRVFAHDVMRNAGVTV